MLDALKVLFILTGASTYLVTKYVNVGLEHNHTITVNHHHYEVNRDNNSNITHHQHQHHHHHNGFPLEVNGDKMKSVTGGRESPIDSEDNHKIKGNSDNQNHVPFIGNQRSKVLLPLNNNNNNNNNMPNNDIVHRKTVNGIRAENDETEDQNGNARRDDNGSGRDDTKSNTIGIRNRNNDAAIHTQRSSSSSLSDSKSQSAFTHHSINSSNVPIDITHETDRISNTNKYKNFGVNRDDDDNGRRITVNGSGDTPLMNQLEHNGDRQFNGNTLKTRNENENQWYQMNKKKVMKETDRSSVPFLLSSSEGSSENDDKRIVKVIHAIAIIEEDAAHLPKLLLQVAPDDSDVSVPDVQYFINSSGYGYDPVDFTRKFYLNATSGELFLVRPLDRDRPFGRPQYNFSIMARHVRHNEPFAFADVVINVRDINDNSPFFSESVYRGSILENSPSNVMITQISAIDYDDPDTDGNAKIRYFIDRNHFNADGDAIFDINPNTGIISSIVCCLNREVYGQYVLQVSAVDGGGLKGNTMVIISVTDVNDCPVKFKVPFWSIELSEDVKINDVILIVDVNDCDLPETNHFNYRIEPNQYSNDEEYLRLNLTFAFITNANGSGSLVTRQWLDLTKFSILNFTISVTDYDESIVNDNDTVNNDNHHYHKDISRVIIISKLNLTHQTQRDTSSIVISDRIYSDCTTLICQNGGICINDNYTGDIRGDNGHSLTRKIVRCQCPSGFKGVQCDNIDDPSDIISVIRSADGPNGGDRNNINFGSYIHQLLSWIGNSDDSGSVSIANGTVIAILFAIVNVIVLILIAIVYIQLKDKFIRNRTPQISPSLSASASPYYHQNAQMEQQIDDNQNTAQTAQKMLTLNNTLNNTNATIVDNNTDDYMMTMTVIPSSSMVPYDGGDQLCTSGSCYNKHPHCHTHPYYHHHHHLHHPDVVGCAEMSCTTGHMFIKNDGAENTTNGGSHWNRSSSDDIRHTMYDMPHDNIWTLPSSGHISTMASKSMDTVIEDQYLEETVIHV